MNKVVVTGARGFVGRKLLEAMEADGNIEIAALSRSAVSPEEGSRCTWVATDYSAKELTEILEGASAVVHLAGTKGDKVLREDFDSDRIMMANLLEAVEACGTPKLIYASSRLVYGSPDTLPWREDSPLQPGSEYGKNKVICENKCRDFCSSHDTDLKIVRIAQVLGYGDPIRNMINVFLSAARNGEEIRVIGRSVHKRQYIYVDDLADILYQLASGSAKLPDTINLGMEEAYTNLRIAQMINEAFGNSTPIDYRDDTEETITSSYMDVSRLTDLMGYRPRDMKTALKEMADQVL